MAGHSHSANIKYRKDRQDSARSQLFLKLRKKFLEIIKKEGKITDEILIIARKNKFPKEKIEQIYKKIQEEENYSQQTGLYEGKFGIWVYWESGFFPNLDIIRKLDLKKRPLSLIHNHFQLVYSLKINSNNSNKKEIGEYLLNLPSSLWEKINYKEEERILFSSDKETMINVKNFIKEEKKLLIEEEKNNWQPLFYCELISQEEQEYYWQIINNFSDKKIYTNIEEALIN